MHPNFWEGPFASVRPGGIFTEIFIIGQRLFQDLSKSADLQGCNYLGIMIDAWSCISSLGNEIALARLRYDKLFMSAFYCARKIHTFMHENTAKLPVNQNFARYPISIWCARFYLLVSDNQFTILHTVGLDDVRNWKLLTSQWNSAHNGANLPSFWY